MNELVQDTVSEEKRHCKVIVTNRHSTSKRHEPGIPAGILVGYVIRVLRRGISANTCEDIDRIRAGS